MYSSICSTCQHEIIIKIKNDVDIWCESSLYSPLNLNNMIEFIQEVDTPTNPTFGDVNDDQFFVSSMGNLYQKHSCDIANKIADVRGVPDCDQVTFREDTNIERILPITTEIKF